MDNKILKEGDFVCFKCDIREGKWYPYKIQKIRKDEEIEMMRGDNRVVKDYILLGYTFFEEIDANKDEVVDLIQAFPEFIINLNQEVKDFYSIILKVK